MLPWTGHRLREARASRGWTQDDLMRETGASKRSIVAWEAEQATPSAKWAHALNELFADLDLPATLTSAPTEVDLTTVDDLDLLAELARRLARARPHRDTAPPFQSGQHAPMPYHLLPPQTGTQRSQDG
jgi:DNA-binding XRE family transcriptional regulator